MVVRREEEGVEEESLRVTVTRREEEKGDEDRGRWGGEE